MSTTETPPAVSARDAAATTRREGTRVTCTDLQTGESESRDIRDDYIIVTDGRMEISAMQFYGNGTVQVTLKRASA